MEYSPAATGPIINYSALSADLSELLGIASMGGQVAEWEIQRHLATRWRAEGLEVREWDLDLERLQLDPAFPGMEVARTAAVGVTATWVGTGGGATLLINAHTDVVPPGDLAAWTGDPFTPRSSTRAGRDVLIARGLGVDETADICEPCLSPYIVDLVRQHLDCVNVAQDGMVEVPLEPDPSHARIWIAHLPEVNMRGDYWLA